MLCLAGANKGFARIVQVKPTWFPTTMLSGIKFAPVCGHYQYLDSCLLNQGHFPIMFKKQPCIKYISTSQAWEQCFCA